MDFALGLDAFASSYAWFVWTGALRVHFAQRLSLFWLVAGADVGK